MLKYLIDAGAAAALFLALLIVFVVDWAGHHTVDTLQNVKVIGGDKRKGDHKKLKLAVTPTAEFNDGFKKDKWDDMGKLLDELGEGYKHDMITEDQLMQLHERSKLNEYDVVFLTCSDRANKRLRDSLQDYVIKGGILYASDWRFDAIANAFPEMVARKLIGEGDKQKLQADVVDPALREVIGDKIPLEFNLPEWKTAAFAGPRVKTLLRGKYLKDKSTEYATAPLMVKFQVEKGTVIFTSFHNEKQNSRVEKQLLQYLVFSLVTAGIDAEINSSLNKEGFTPQRSNLLSNAQDPSVVKTYENKEECTLRFTLGFRGDGAKLTFNIKSPDGKQFTRDSESTIAFEVPNAAKGTWTYTVTADRAYANFPFTVTVGAKK